ncbi:hypothetical protein LB504_006698 [Fusarium proliferatum]|nr:hypothetical protein LB504_006698 [Fusarium proliferatum]
MAPCPVELDRPAWALTFEPCSILGIHQHPSPPLGPREFRLHLNATFSVSATNIGTLEGRNIAPIEASHELETPATVLTCSSARILWLVLPATS